MDNSRDRPGPDSGDCPAAPAVWRDLAPHRRLFFYLVPALFVRLYGLDHNVVEIAVQHACPLHRQKSRTVLPSSNPKGDFMILNAASGGRNVGLIMLERILQHTNKQAPITIPALPRTQGSRSTRALTRLAATSFSLRIRAPEYSWTLACR